MHTVNKTEKETPKQKKKPQKMKVNTCHDQHNRRLQEQREENASVQRVTKCWLYVDTATW